jgi:hypothetical protein
MKQTFNIPEGCNTVTVEQVGNQLITTFEPEKYVPKKGDFVKIKYKEFKGFTFCLVDNLNGKRIESKNVWIRSSNESPFEFIKFSEANFFAYDSIEKITPGQFQAEFEKLGYIYDFETNTASKKIFRAKHGDYYYKLDSYFKPVKLKEVYDNADAENFSNNNYFETEEQSKSAADFLKRQLKEFKNK